MKRTLLNTLIARLLIYTDKQPKMSDFPRPETSGSNQSQAEASDMLVVSELGPCSGLDEPVGIDTSLVSAIGGFGLSGTWLALGGGRIGITGG